MTASGQPSAAHMNAWRAAEDNAAAWLRHWGYRDAAVTPPGADNGIDVVGRGVLGQVKFEAAQVGRPALQRLVGAGAGRDAQLIFFTGAGYSAPAVQYANEQGLALFLYDLQGRMRPVNAPAERVARSSVEVSPGMYEHPDDAEPIHFGCPPEDTFRALYAVCREMGNVREVQTSRLKVTLKRDASGANGVLWVTPADDGAGSEISYRIIADTHDRTAMRRLAGVQHQRIRRIEEATLDRINSGVRSPAVGVPVSAGSISDAIVLIAMATLVVGAIIAAIVWKP